MSKTSSGRDGFRRMIGSVCAALVVTTFMTSAANASCGDRPGTPNEVRLEVLTSTSLRASWRNTTGKGMNPSGSVSRDPPHKMYFDMYLDLDGGRNTGRNLTGHGPFDVAYGHRSSYDWTGLAPQTKYCFAMRARSEARTKGCISAVTSNWACATTPDAAADTFCQKYTEDAFNQVGNLQSYRKGGECAPTGGRWDVQRQHHYDWCVSVRGQAQSAGWPDNERKIRNDILAKCKPAATQTSQTTRPGTGTAPSSRPAITAVNIQKGGAHRIEGRNLLPNAPVTVRVVNRTLRQAVIMQIGTQRIRALPTGTLDITLINLCGGDRNDQLSISINDGRADPNDRPTGALWSNTVTVGCQG